MQNNTLKLVNEFASGYDDYIQNSNWCGPDMLFGLMFEFLKPHQKILDLGIGTGLSATLFQKAGHEIYGVDGSEEMLEICRSKFIATELKYVDLSKSDIPFNIIFDCIISFAVFHFLDDLESLFIKLSGKIKDDGIFGFSVDIYDKDSDYNEYVYYRQGIYQKITKENGLQTFKYTFEYVEQSLQFTGFKIIKNTDIVAFYNQQQNRKVWFKLIVAAYNKK